MEMQKSVGKHLHSWLKSFILVAVGVGEGEEWLVGERDPEWLRGERGDRRLIYEALFRNIGIERDARRFGEEFCTGAVGEGASDGQKGPMSTPTAIGAGCQGPRKLR